MILSDAAKDGMLQGLADTLNVGSNATLTVCIGEVVAAVFEMTNPVEQSIIGGVISFDLPPKVLATESGIPTKAILKDSLGADVVIFDVGAEIVLDKESIYMGGYVSLISLTITI